MKAYRVEIEKLSFDYGRFEGYKLIGYYTNKEKAERIAKERYENRCKVVEGETQITEIEIDTED
jgi:hypothetical protein